MWSIAHTVVAVLWRPIAKSLGGGLYYVKFVPVVGVSVMCVEPVCLYRVEPMPLVRPTSPGLTWGTLPGVMSRLRRGGKIGHGIVIIPCCCLSTFTLEGLYFPARGKGSQSYSMVKTL